MDKIIRMRISSVNTTTGNATVHSTHGHPTQVRLSDKVLHYGIDENDIAIIKIIGGEYVATDFEKAQKADPITDDFDADEVMGVY